MSTIEKEMTPRVAEPMQQSRLQFVEALGRGLLFIAGPCSQDEEPAILAREAARMAGVAQRVPGAFGVFREPTWKPRSRPEEDWNGLETTNPQLAQQMTEEHARAHANVAIELGFREHSLKYGLFLTFGWVGGRNIDNRELQEFLAVHDPSLSLGIKNGLSGDIDEAIDIAVRLQALRPNGAPIVPIFRGGEEKAGDPNAWERMYKHGLERTHGLLIVDAAHGGEMAHDPSGRFGKTEDGQIACLDHIISLAKQGFIAAGVMIEASDMPISQTDPNIQFDIAEQKMHELAEAVQS